jgi:error-prone DNA polymerase
LPLVAGTVEERESAGGMGGGRRRVLVHASGFRQSPYADIKPAGVSGSDPRKLAEEAAKARTRATGERGAGDAPRRLWHASQGSSGR